jgi:hypothetical protein
MIIGFDFDGCLQTDEVQAVAIQAIKDGHNVWCVTSRTGNTWRGHSNDDLHEVCDRVGIEAHKRIFCSKAYWQRGVKVNFYLDMSKIGVIFDIHLDDHDGELLNIRSAGLKTKTINTTNKNWKTLWDLATQ